VVAQRNRRHARQGAVWTSDPLDRNTAENLGKSEGPICCLQEPPPDASP